MSGCRKIINFCQHLTKCIWKFCSQTREQNVNKTNRFIALLSQQLSLITKNVIYVSQNVKSNKKGLRFGSFCLLSFVNIIPSMYNGPFQTEKSKAERYWGGQRVSDLLEEADRLYEQEEYFEIYEMLNRLQYSDNAEIQWRVCRALYKMSAGETDIVRKNMIQEAYTLINRALDLNGQHPEIHKWMAIILDTKTGNEGTVSRVRAAPKVKHHMMRSVELNPNDPTTLHMLGHWCFEMTQLSWVQRKIARLMFYDPPKASYEEAYQYFMRAEELRPRFYIGNMYMLGRCCYHMGSLYRARYYLRMAADLPATTDVERKQSAEARRLAEQLDEYEVNMDTFPN